MKVFFFGLILLALPSIMLAHGLVTTLSENNNGYTVEFEYNKLGKINAGDLTTFDIYFMDKDLIPKHFDGAYISIGKPNTTPSLVSLMQEDPTQTGYAQISGILNEPGEYTAEVHVNEGGEVVARTTYNFAVEGTNNQSSQPKHNSNWLYLASTGLIAFIVGFVLARVGKSSKQ